MSLTPGLLHPALTVKKMGHNIRYCPRVSQQWVPVVKPKAPQNVDPADKSQSTIIPPSAKGKSVAPSPVVCPQNLQYDLVASTSVVPTEVMSISPINMPSSCQDSPMVIDEPEFVVALPAQVKPTQKVLDFISAASTTNPLLNPLSISISVTSKKTTFKPLKPITSVLFLALNIPFASLSNNHEPVGSLLYFICSRSSPTSRGVLS